MQCSRDVENRGFFCVYWVSQFEGLPSQCSQLIVKAMFAQLRKLQFFKVVESCLAGFGQCRSQWVKKKMITSLGYRFVI